jgi:hypothetical protein
MPGFRILDGVHRKDPKRGGAVEVVGMTLSQLGDFHGRVPLGLCNRPACSSRLSEFKHARGCIPRLDR